MALIGRCQAQGGDEEDRHEGWGILNLFVMMYTIMVILITLLLRWLWDGFQRIETPVTPNDEDSEYDSEGPGLEMFGQERPRRASSKRRATPGMGIIRNGVMEERPEGRRNQDGGGSRRSPSTRTPTEPSRSQSGHRHDGSASQGSRGPQGSVPTQPPSTRTSPSPQDLEDVSQDPDYMAEINEEMRRRERVAQYAAENPPTPSPNEEPYQEGMAMDEDAAGQLEGVNGHRQGPQNMPHPPDSAYPAEMTKFYLTPTGSRYHLNRQCRGLQNAAVVLESPRCPRCLPIEPRWNPGNRTLYGAGILHGNNTHKIVSTEKPHLYREFEPCHVCAGRRGKGGKGKGDAEGGKGTWIL